MKHQNILNFIIVSFLLHSCQKLNVTPNESEIIPLTSANILKNNWEYKKVENIPNGFYDIFFKNIDTGYAIANFEIYKSYDGGSTWMRQNFRIENTEKTERYSPFINLTVTPNNYIYIAANSNALLLIPKSSDTVIGRKILTTYTGSDARQVTGIYSISDSNIYFTMKDSIVSSKDGGKTWKNTPKIDISKSSDSYSNISFYTSSYGLWANGKSLYLSQGSDSVWRKSNFNFTGQIHSIALTSPKTAFVSTKNGLFKSSGSFDSFNQVFKTAKENNYMSISFVNDDIGYISFNNFIYKTTDGGNSWTMEVALVNPKYEIIWEIHAIDEQHVWACTSNGGVLRKK